MRLSISQAAKIGGVSVRTLRYYDEIGLIHPAEVSPAGYRYYDEEALRVLAQVRFYRELELPLKEILSLFRHPDYDASQTLRDHRALLLLRRQRIDEQLRALDGALEGKNMQPPKTTLADIRKAKETYAQETRERYGNTAAYRESQSHRHTDEESLVIAAEMDDIFSGFAQHVGEAPDSQALQSLVRRWQEHITRHHYACTLPILSGLADMYIADERFTANLERFGAGTAQCMHDAIKAYCASQGYDA